MNTRIGMCAARRPRWTICLWSVITAAAAPFAPALSRHLEAGGFTNPRGDAVRTQHIAEQTFKQVPNTLMLVLSGDRPVDGPVGTARLVAAHLPHLQAVQDFHRPAQWLSAEAIAVALDTVVIRRVLMPAAILLAGSRLWGSASRPAYCEPALAGGRR
ncbi:hypothetical protein [Streptomyces sp. NPDC020362]|uniref:hypothetical protein n=1 Tax=unclassified Streptomyces TaxID=2593676 RepID=UPI000ADE6C75